MRILLSPTAFGPILGSPIFGNSHIFLDYTMKAYSINKGTNFHWP